jgi:hypothetical protein
LDVIADLVMAFGEFARQLFEPPQQSHAMLDAKLSLALPN